MKLFYFFAVMILSLGFVSCGDDDDPVLGDKSDLIGRYVGDESVSLTNINKEVANSVGNVRFERYSQDANRLSVSTEDLGTGILASNFRISKEDYTFNLAKIDLIGLKGNEIPSYIRDWFAGDYDSLEKVDLKLTATSGKFNRTTNKMEFTYKGDLVIYPVIGTATQPAVTHKIEFKYFNLTK